jgi:Rod binding domain-containing protein
MTPTSGLGPIQHNPYLTSELAGIRQAAAGGAAETDPEADKVAGAAREFESVFLSTIFNRMFESIETDGPFGGGEAERTWRSFLAEQYAGEVARQGGIGLADAVRAELVGLQEKANQ